MHLLPTGSYYDLGCQSEGCSTLDHFHGVVYTFALLANVMPQLLHTLMLSSFRASVSVNNGQ